MRAWIAVLAAVVLAGCDPTPKDDGPVARGPDVDIEVMAMQSRPLRVFSAPSPLVKPTIVLEKPKPRRKRRRPRPKPVEKVTELPPDESFAPKPAADEPPIDIPADSPDVAEELAKEFKRRDRERKRRRGDEGE